jgi:hypothetical protein
MSTTRRLLAFVLALVPTQLAASPIAERARELAANQPLVFEANRGQLEAAVPFLGRSANETVFLRGDGATLQFETAHGVAPRIELRWLGGNPAARAHGEWQLPGTTGYFFGPDPNRHVAGIPTFERVRVREVYPGIDVLYRSSGSRLEYDFVVGPGADPRQIQIEIAGADRVELNDDGHLTARTGSAELFQPRPVIYQEIDGRRIEIGGGFEPLARAEGSRFAFRLDAYDETRELVIDPLVLWYSTKTGGTDNVYFGDLAVQPDGDVFLTGVVQRTFGQPFTFPITGGITPFPVNCGFVMKIRATTSTFEFPEIEYSVVFGGASPQGIAIDDDETVHLTGGILSGNSADFPFGFHVGDANPNGSTDAFVMSFEAGGATLLFSSFFGGHATELGIDVAVDDQGHPCIVGETEAEAGFPSFPQKPTPRPVAGTQDVFVACFDTQVNGTAATIFSLLLGGQDTGFGDRVGGIAARGALDVAVLGETNSADFPVLNGFQTGLRGASDLFVTRIAGGEQPEIKYSTYLGGTAREYRGISNAIVFERAVDRLVVVGSSDSVDFPLVATSPPAQGNKPGADVVVARLSTTRVGVDSLIGSTYLGGNSADAAYSVARNPSTGAISVVGSTYSTDFPVRGPIDHHNLFGQTIWDGRVFPTPAANFVTTFDSRLQQIQMSTSVPGNASTLGADAQGAIYTAGLANLAQLPIVRPLRLQGVAVGQQGNEPAKTGLVKIAPSGS